MANKITKPELENRIKILENRVQNEQQANVQLKKQVAEVQTRYNNLKTNSSARITTQNAQIHILKETIKESIKE